MEDQGRRRTLIVTSAEDRNPLCPPCSAAHHVVRESLKWKTKDADAVEALHDIVPRLLEIAQTLQVRCWSKYRIQLVQA